MYIHFFLLLLVYRSLARQDNPILIHELLYHRPVSYTHLDVYKRQGYDDPNFIKDFDLMKNLYEEIPTLLQNMESLDDKDVIIEGLKTLEIIKDYTYRLKMYAQLRLAVDSNETDNTKWANTTLNLASSLKTYENALLDKILEAPCLKEMIETDAFVHQYKFILLEQLNKKDHKLDSKQEEILSMVYPTSLKAFSDMYYALTGNATALYDGKEQMCIRDS